MHSSWVNLKSGRQVCRLEAQAGADPADLRQNFFLPLGASGIALQATVWLNKAATKVITPSFSLLGFALKYISEELTHLKIPWCWERLKEGGEGDDRRWDGGVALPTQWTWVWVNSRSWWWIRRPCMLRFMGLQRVGHGWVTKLNWMVFLCERFI